MADAKIINYGQPIGAGTTVIPDNQVALDIESTDGSTQVRIKTTDDAEAVTFLDDHTTSVENASPKNESSGFVGIRCADPKAPLHLIGQGGKTSMSFDPTANDCATVIVENGNAHSKDRLAIALNGQTQSKIKFYVADSEKMEIHAGASSQKINGGNSLDLQTGGTSRLLLESGTSGFSNGIRQAFAATNDFYQTGNEMRMDLSLASSAIWVMDADIDEVKFGFYPGANQCATFTAIIQQNSSGGGSANEIVWPTVATGYSASFSGSTYNSIPIYWAGGIKPTISTGANDIDVIQFLCTDEGGTRKVFASVVGQDFQQ
jgi:hypothetical protein